MKRVVGFLIFSSSFFANSAFAETQTSFLQSTNLQCISSAMEKTMGLRPSEKYLFLLASASNYKFCWRLPDNTCLDQHNRKLGNFGNDLARTRMMSDVVRRLQVYGSCSGQLSQDNEARFHFRDDGSWLTVSPVLTGPYRPGWGSMTTVTGELGFKKMEDFDKLFGGTDLYKIRDTAASQIEYDKTLNSFVKKMRRGGKKDPTSFGGICIPENGNWLKECLFELDEKKMQQGLPRITKSTCQAIAKECHLNASICNEPGAVPRQSIPDEREIRIRNSTR